MNALPLLAALPFAWPRSRQPLLETQMSIEKQATLVSMNVPSASAFLFACAASRSARIFARRARSDLAWSVLPWACNCECRDKSDSGHAIKRHSSHLPISLLGLLLLLLLALPARQLTRRRKIRDGQALARSAVRVREEGVVVLFFLVAVAVRYALLRYGCSLLLLLELCTLRAAEFSLGFGGTRGVLLRFFFFFLFLLLFLLIGVLFFAVARGPEYADASVSVESEAGAPSANEDEGFTTSGGDRLGTHHLSFATAVPFSSRTRFLLSE